MRLSKQMKRLGSCLTLLAVTLGLGTGVIYAQLQSTPQEQKFVRAKKDAIPNSYLVVLKPEYRGLGGGTLEEDADSEKKIKAVADVLMKLYHGGYISLFTPGLGFSVRELSEDVAIRMSRDYRVEVIYQNTGIRRTGQVFDPTKCANGVPPVCNWGLDRMDQRELPLDNNYRINFTGSGVNVYVVDTGILATHQDFTGRVVLAYDRFSGTNGVPSDNANQADCDKDDNGRLIGHGTGVASIVGGGLAGVAKNVKLYSVRVLSCTEIIGDSEDVAAGLRWVKANAIKPAVVNLSLTAVSAKPRSEDVIDAAVTDLIKSGIPVVIAAGQDNADASLYTPARVPEAITVSGSSIRDARGRIPDGPLFNFGSILDLFAAGESILTASANDPTEYFSTSGTSFAAPQVTGAVALFLEVSKNATPDTIEKYFITQSTKDKLTNIGAGSANRLLYIPIIKVVRDIDRDKTVDESYGCNVLNASDRNTYWTTRLSTTGAPDPVVPTFGEYYHGIWDRLVPADYDGDGLSTNPVPGSYTSYLRYGDPYGNDMPMPGDYDGDGKADPAIWRRSTREIIDGEGVSRKTRVLG